VEEVTGALVIDRQTDLSVRGIREERLAAKRQLGEPCRPNQSWYSLPGALACSPRPWLCRSACTNRKDDDHRKFVRLPLLSNNAARN